MSKLITLAKMNVLKSGNDYLRENLIGQNLIGLYLAGHNLAGQKYGRLAKNRPHFVRPN